MPKPHSSSPDFLVRLQQEALKQSYLDKYRWLPKQADWLTSYIGQHTWQFVVVTATFLSVVLQLLKVSQ